MPGEYRERTEGQTVRREEKAGGTGCDKTQEKRKKRGG